MARLFPLREMAVSGVSMNENSRFRRIARKNSQKEPVEGEEEEQNNPQKNAEEQPI